MLRILSHLISSLLFLLIEFESLQILTLPIFSKDITLYTKEEIIEDDFIFS